MKSVIQRVENASVKVEGQTVGEISKGLLVFLTVHKNDTEKDIDKTVTIIFET